MEQWTKTVTTELPGASSQHLFTRAVQHYGHSVTLAWLGIWRPESALGPVLAAGRGPQAGLAGRVGPQALPGTVYRGRH